MTLIVGILCANGAVIAADRQATHGSLGQRTVGQAVAKISPIGQTGLLATSGHHGLGQQLEAIVVRKHKDCSNYPYDKAILDIQAEFRKVIEPAMQTARVAAAVVGNQAAASDAICSCLLVCPFKDGLKVVEITPQVAVEFLTPELSFISLGSGKAGADPFLGFLRMVFWPDKPPTVREAALAAWWTIHHAIEMRADAVGMGIDVWTIEPSGPSFTRRKYDDSDFFEHQEFIKSAMDGLKALRDQLSTAPSPGTATALEPPTLKK